MENNDPIAEDGGRNNNDPIAEDGGRNINDDSLRVSLGAPSIMLVSSPQPSSSRVHSLFYGDTRSSSLVRPSGVPLLPAAAAAPSTVAHLPQHNNSSQSTYDSNLLNSYLVDQQQQQIEHHEETLNLGPTDQLYSPQGSEANVLAVSWHNSLIGQSNSQSLNRNCTNTHSNTTKEIASPKFHSPSSSSLCTISSDSPQQSFSLPTTTSKANGSIQRVKSTRSSEMNLAPLNEQPVLPPMQSPSRIEASSAAARQAFAPIVTSGIPTSRPTSTASSSRVMSHCHNYLPLIVSSAGGNSRSVASSSRNGDSLYGNHSRNAFGAHLPPQISLQNQNDPAANRSAEPFVRLLQGNASANMPSSSFRSRQANVDFLPVSVLSTDNAPQPIPELLLEPNEAQPVVQEEPSISGVGVPNARMYTSRRMFSPDDECLVSSSTERALEPEFGVDESGMGSSTNPSMPLLDSTVDSTGDPTPLDCLDSPADVYVSSPVDSNSSSIDDPDTDLVSSVRYPRSAIISASSLKNIALASFPPKSLDSDSSDDDTHHMIAENFPSRNHHQFSSSPLKSFQATSSGGRHSKLITLSPSSSCFSSFPNTTSAGPSQGENNQHKQQPIGNEQEEPEHIDDASSSQDSIEGVASSLELSLSSAGHGLGCSDSVARSTPLLPPAQILERETPSPPPSSSRTGYQQDFQEYCHHTPPINNGIETISESSPVNPSSGSSLFVPVHTSLHSSTPQYQLSSIEVSSEVAHHPGALSPSISFASIHGYSSMETLVPSTSSTGNCSSASGTSSSVKRSRLASMPEMAMPVATAFSTLRTNPETLSVTGSANIWSDTNTSPGVELDSVTEDIIHLASSSTRVAVATTKETGTVAGSSSETFLRTSNTRQHSDKRNEISISFDHGSLMNQRKRFTERGTEVSILSYDNGSATCDAANVTACSPLQSESFLPCSQTPRSVSSKCRAFSSAVHDTISVSGLFSPIVSHVPSHECSGLSSSRCSKTAPSSPTLDSFGSIAGSESLLVSSAPNPINTTSEGVGLARESNMHSLFHPPVFVKTDPLATVALSSGVKDDSNRSFQSPLVNTYCPTVSPTLKKVLLTSVKSVTSSVEASGSNGINFQYSMAKSASSTVTAFSNELHSIRETCFKPIPKLSTTSFNKDFCHSKPNLEESIPLISYEVRFDGSDFPSFCREDYLPLSPSSAPPPSAPFTTNSRFAMNFCADAPAIQSQAVNFSSMPPVEASHHTPERQEASLAKFVSASSAALDPSEASLHSSSTLSPLTMSFNSSNSLLGNSFEIFPSGQSFIEKIPSQYFNNSPPTTTTTYTVGSSSSKLDQVRASENSSGPLYPKYNSVTASFCSPLQEVAASGVRLESDTNKYVDDYDDQSVPDPMKMLGDAYVNQGENSSSKPFTARATDHGNELIASNDPSDQALKHKRKRQQAAGVSALETGFGGVTVAVVESHTSKNSEAVSVNTNILLASEVDQTAFSSIQTISNESCTGKQPQRKVFAFQEERNQNDLSSTQEETRGEAQDQQYSNLLSRRHGDKPEIVHRPPVKEVAQIKEGRSSTPAAPRERVSRRAKKRSLSSPQPRTDDTGREYVDGGETCSLHDVGSITDGHSISDRTVLSRAWASLPSQHLSIRRLPSSRDSRQCGVFSKRRIDQHTFFGPMVGMAKPDGAPTDTSQNASISSLAYKFTSSTGEVMVLDTTDIETSNWMCFVGAASCLAHQNCVVVEREDSAIYFFTTRPIAPSAQLRVGYSKQYAAKYGFEALEATPQEIQAAEERNSWPCYECDALLTSSADLQQHLSTHEVNEPPKRKARARIRLTSKRRRKAGTRQAGKRTPAPELSNAGAVASSCSSSSPLRGPVDGAPALLSCLVCDKTFSNSKVLSLHQLQHGRPGSGLQQTAQALSCPQCSQVHGSREELLAHVESHTVQPTERRLRREEKPATAATGAQDDIEQPLDKAAVQAPGPAPAEEPSHEFGSSEPRVVTKLYDCPICRQEMLSLQQLRAHLPHHVDERGRYHCPTCGRDFDSYRKVRRHIRAYCFHVLHCTECNRPFPSAVKLKMHMLTHSDRRDFKCDSCEGSFKRKDKLRDHQKRVHGPNSSRPPRPNITVPSVANKKDKVQASNAETYRHRNSAYQCRLCLLGFKRRGMLVNHTLKRHPEVALGCVPDLNKPLQSAVMEYRCPHCSKVYRSNIRRNLHLSKAHPGSHPLPPNTLVSKPSSTAASDTGCEGGAAASDPPKYAARCKWCHREYMTQAKLNQHHRKYHRDKLLPTDKEATPSQQQEQIQPGAASVIEVASGSPLFEEMKQHKHWDQPIIGYYVDNNNVTRQHHQNGKANGVTQTEFVVYNSAPINGGGEGRSATSPLSNDDVVSKYSNTKSSNTGDLLTQAMGVICLDMNNATVASSSASNLDTLVNGRIVHAVEKDGQVHKQHSTQSLTGPIIVNGDEATVNNGAILGQPLPTAPNLSGLTPASCEQQQNGHVAKSSSTELVTLTLLAPDSGNTYTIALPPGQLIQLAPNVVASTNTGIIVNEGVAYSTVVPVSR